MFPSYIAFINPAKPINLEMDCHIFLALVMLVFVVSGSDAQNNTNSGSQISCYDGYGPNSTVKNNCQSCQTSTTWPNGGGQTNVYYCSTSCTPSDSTSNGYRVMVSCCYTNSCNTPSNQGSGVKCYDSDGSIKDGCKYCQRIVNTFASQFTISRSCSSTCTVIDVGIVKTVCCQNDLCNQATFTMMSNAFILCSLLLSVGY